MHLLSNNFPGSYVPFCLRAIATLEIVVLQLPLLGVQSPPQSLTLGAICCLLLKLPTYNNNQPPYATESGDFTFYAIVTSYSRVPIRRGVPNKRSGLLLHLCHASNKSSSSHD